MSTTDKRPADGGPYVSRDVCEAFRQEQRDANARTWQEIRALRRLVILLVVGGQLFSGGLNVAGVTYWLEERAARPHPSAVKMVTAARDEARQDLKDLRREMHELVLSVMPRPGESPPCIGPNEGDRE